MIGWALIVFVAVAALVIAIVALARKGGGSKPQKIRSRTKRGDSLQQTNLISDIAGIARTTDANLVNPWGVVLRNPSSSGGGSGRGGSGGGGGASSFAVADNGTGLLTFYSLDGTPQPPVVTIQAPATGGTTATPSGLVPVAKDLKSQVAPLHCLRS